MIRLPLKRQDHTVYDGAGYDFCYCPGDTPEEAETNAAFVVTACNNYQALLAACKLIVEAERAANEELNFQLLIEATELARAAIAQTEEAQ